MKDRNFYPKQVMRKIKGKSVDSLDCGEKAALKFFFLRGRKYGFAISIINNAKPEHLLSTGSKEEAAIILANASSKIFLKEALT